MYHGLTDVPWFGAFGNHDYGDGDLFATCPERRPLGRVEGQAYASLQVMIRLTLPVPKYYSW